MAWQYRICGRTHTGLNHVAACSRPTAVNLQIAATRLSAVARKEAGIEGGSGLSVAVAVISAADAMMKDDIAANKACCRYQLHLPMMELSTQDSESAIPTRHSLSLPDMWVQDGFGAQKRLTGP